MKAELVKELLTIAGYSDELINLATTEEALPETFNKEEVITTWKETRKALAEQTFLKPAIDKALKENYPAVIMPFVSLLKKEGLTDEDLKGENDLYDVKKGITTLATTLKKSATGTDTALQKEANDLRTKFGEANASLQKVQTDFEAFKLSAEQEKEAFKNNLLVEQTVARELNKIDWAASGPTLSFDKDGIKREVLNRYKVNADGSLEMPTGGKAIRPDNNGFFATFEEAATHFADLYKKTKKSIKVTDTKFTKGGGVFTIDGKPIKSNLGALKAVLEK